MPDPTGKRRRASELVGLEAVLAEIDAVDKDIRNAQRDSSWTAVSALRRNKEVLMRRADELREDQAAEPVDPAQLAEALLGAVPELDDVTFARLAEAVDLRRGTRAARREVVR